MRKAKTPLPAKKQGDQPREADRTGPASRSAGRRSLAPLTARLPLGALQVSPACLGMIGGRSDAVLEAFDAGINFFFVSADLHWPRYASLRRGLTKLLARGGSIRERIVVAACSYASRAGGAAEAWSELLRAVPRLERLDVLAVGAVVDGDLAPRLHALHAAVDRGFCGARASAASFHQREACAVAYRGGLVDLALVRYNAAHPRARSELFPQLAPGPRPLLFTFKSTTGHVPAAELDRLGVPASEWRPRVADHYRFALSAPPVRGVLGSWDGGRQLADLESALAEGPLDDPEQAYLVNLCRLQRGEIEMA